MTAPDPDAVAPGPSAPESPQHPPRDPWPLYPILVAAFPVLSIFSANLSILSLSDLWRPLATAAMLGAALTALGWFVFRSARRGAAFATAVSIALWTYSATATHLLPDTFEMFRPRAWAFAAFIFVALLTAWAPKVRFLNTLAVLMTLVAASTTAYSYLRPPVAAVQDAHPGRPLPAGPRPDVFVLLLDGFGRVDQLKRAIGVDLSWFAEGLRARGFQVADRAHSNYVQTELSIGSSLNLDTLQRLLPNTRPDFEDRRILDPLIAEPAMARRLMASGYRYIAIGTGFDGLRFGRYERPVPRSGAITLFESTLLAMTPYVLREDGTQGAFNVRRERLKNVFGEVARMAPRTGTPRFVFVHILAPHPPFVLGPEGESVRQRGPYGYWDGSDYRTYVGSAPEYRAGYAGQVRYVASRVLDTIDALMALPEAERPIIVVQGDHGSKVGLDQNSLERTDIPEAMSILAAAYFPPAVGFQVAPDTTPINLMRGVLTALGATDLPPVPNQSWYSTYPRPFAFTDVTRRLAPSQGGAEPDRVP